MRIHTTLLGKSGAGTDSLLETLLFQADVMNLAAGNVGFAEATVSS